MAAYRDRNLGPVYVVALLIYAAAGLGLLGVILWKLWTEVLAQWPL